MPLVLVLLINLGALLHAGWMAECDAYPSAALLDGLSILGQDTPITYKIDTCRLLGRRSTLLV